MSMLSLTTSHRRWSCRNLLKCVKVVAANAPPAPEAQIGHTTLFGWHANVHQSHLEWPWGSEGCRRRGWWVSGKAGPSHLYDGSPHSSGCVVNAMAAFWVVSCYYYLADTLSRAYLQETHCCAVAECADINHTSTLTLPAERMQQFQHASANDPVSVGPFGRACQPAIQKFPIPSISSTTSWMNWQLRISWYSRGHWRSHCTERWWQCATTLTLGWRVVFVEQGSPCSGPAWPLSWRSTSPSVMCTKCTS